MRTDGNYGRTLSYEPNSFGEWRDSPAAKEPPLEIHGAAFNYDEREYDDDYYTQPGKLWRLMPPEEQKLTCENTARAMDGVPLFIKQRRVRGVPQCRSGYGSQLADALGISLEEALVAEDPAHPEWDKREIPSTKQKHNLKS